MCVIMAIERKFPDLKLLELAEKENDDGAGIAWIQDGLVHWEKGLTAKEVHKIGMSTPAPWVVHFRMMSSGTNSKNLTHPFPITPKAGTHLKGTANSVLFHNGTLENDEMIMFTALNRNRHKIPEGDWSDSRVLAYAYYHLGEGILNFIGWTQRVAVLDKDLGICTYGYWATTNNSNLKLSSPIKALEKKKEDKKTTVTTMSSSNTTKIQNWAKEHNYSSSSQTGWVRGPNDPEFEMVDGVYRPKRVRLIEDKSTK